LLIQQKTGDSINSWITNLRAKAKIQYFVNY